MHQIALAAGIGQGTLYRRYRHKGELCMDLMRERHERFVEEITALLDAAEAEPAFRWLELGGSLARDAGDELSDIDAGLGIADSDWPAAVTLVEETIRRAGPAAYARH